jgi:hypothetical protein
VQSLEEEAAAVAAAAAERAAEEIAVAIARIRAIAQELEMIEQIRPAAEQ